MQSVFTVLFHFSTSSYLQCSRDTVDSIEIAAASHDQQKIDIDLLDTTMSELDKSPSQPPSACSSPPASVCSSQPTSVCSSASEPKKQKKDASSFEEEFLKHLDSKGDRFDWFGDEVAESMRELPAGYVQDEAMREIGDILFTAKYAQPFAQPSAAIPFQQL